MDQAEQNLHLMVAEILWDETEEPSLAELQKRNKFSDAIWNVIFFFKNSHSFDENGKSKEESLTVSSFSASAYLCFLFFLVLIVLGSIIGKQNPEAKTIEYITLSLGLILFGISFPTYIIHFRSQRKKINQYFANPINKAKRQLAGHVKIFNKRVQLFNNILRGESLNLNLLTSLQKQTIREALLKASQILNDEKNRLETLEKQQVYIANLHGMMAEQKEISLTSAIIELERVDNLIAETAQQIHLDIASLQIQGLEAMEQEMLGLPGHELSSATSNQAETSSQVRADQSQEEVVQS